MRYELTVDSGSVVLEFPDKISAEDFLLIQVWMAAMHDKMDRLAAIGGGVGLD